MEIEGLTIDDLKMLYGDAQLTIVQLQRHIAKQAEYIGILEAEKPPLDEAAEGNRNGADSTEIPAALER